MTRAPLRPPRARERGFTLLELLVATAILLLVVLLASQLLVESQRRIALAARELAEPDEVLALRQLRDDLRAALAVHGSGDGPLDCRRADYLARWEVAGERLERRLFDRDGVDRGARPMLDGVARFAWRPLGPAAIEVELLRRRPSAGAALRAGSARWRPLGGDLASVRVVVGRRVGSP